MLDDISTSCRKLKESSFGIADGRLETLKEGYFELVNAEYPHWLQDVESQSKKTG